MAEKENFPPVYANQNSVPSVEKVQLQLQRILASSEFRGTVQQRAMLEFVVLETLAGRAREIKGYTVATRVFGRSADFDQATDPIVSIQANKLRRALERYYLIAGQDDPVRIDIPKGTYVPTFYEQAEVERDRTPGSDEGSTTGFEGSWPTVVIWPFQNLTDDPELKYMAIGLATELATEITRYQDVRVLVFSPERQPRQISDIGVRFAIDGSVRKDLSGIKVAIQLIDLSNNLQIWCDSHFSEFDAGQMIQFQEQVARTIAAKITGEFGIIARAISVESKKIPPSELKTYEAILQYHEYNSNFTPDTFLRAFEALKFATAKEPECGLVWSMLARLYASNYSLELFDLDTPLEDAVAFAQKGVRLEPGNRRVRLILAYVLLLRNNLAQGIAEVERAIGLNPKSLLHMEHCGYLLTLLGDWQRGPAMIKEAMKNNPFYDIIVHYALWVDWVRQEDHQQAYLETVNFRTPMLFWDPLMKAANFGLLGRIEKGRQAAKNLLTLKPDFRSRGRVLIGHYIKFEEIVECIVEGLNKVGLSLD
jgi:TolB-like protein